MGPFPIMIELVGSMGMDEATWQPLVPSIGFAVNQSPTIIGSQPLSPSNIVISIDHGPVISRRHAIVYFDETDWYIEDMGSDNGTWLMPVGGKAIVLKVPLNIQDGLHVLVGPVVVKFHTKLDF